MWIMLWHQEPWGVIPHEQQKERARAQLVVIWIQWAKIKNLLIWKNGKRI